MNFIVYSYGNDHQVPKEKNSSTTNQFCQAGLMNVERKALFCPAEEQLRCYHSLEGVSQDAWNTQMSLGTTYKQPQRTREIGMWLY